MPAINTVRLIGRAINIYSLTGEVVHASESSSVSVSGGGGGGYLNQGNGYVSHAPVTSQTTIHNKLFIKSANGQETAVELSGQENILVRSGHRVSVLWGIVEGRKKGPYCALYNHTTRDTHLLTAHIADLANPWWIKWGYIAVIFYTALLGLMVLVSILSGDFSVRVLLFSLALSAAGVYVIRAIRDRWKKVHAAIEQSIVQLCSQEA